ncbi:hypothetical protein B0H16DRAFT_1476214 [Mycena metata]|uniref:Uncharacterized protein n=1 Tax=Mycena metata TaxID=1033252 RepID=A0AAD7MHJ2_9AGAR|nr:hypothetical protein B0H16DRAFT_1476214 [Mycena metata]
MAAVEFSHLLDAQLALNHYSLPAPPEDKDVGEPNNLHSQRWILLHTTIRSGVYTLKPHPKVNDNTFGYRDFVKLDGKFSNPSTDDNAPVTLPWIQVVAKPGKASRNEPLDINCYDDLCPVTENINPFPDSSIKITSPPHRVRRQVSPLRAQSPIEIDQEPVDPPLPPPLPPPLHPLLPPLELGVDILEPSNVEEWYENVCGMIRPVAAAHPFAYLHTKMIEAGGECLLDLIIYIETHFSTTSPFVMCNQDPQQEEVVGVRGTGQAPTSITHGADPERTIIRHAAMALSGHYHYWQQAPSLHMFRPVFTPGAIPIPQRIHTFRVHRMFLALHCLLLQHGPFPISISLLLCFIEGKEALLIPQNVLLHMDPGAHNILAPWYEFHQDTPVPPATNPSHPPNLIANTRAKAEHNGWKISAFATILLGHNAPWDLPECIAITEGFNFAVGALRFAETVDAVAAHLGQQIASRSPDHTTSYFVKLFMLCVDNCIHGVGHPPEMRVIKCGSDSDMTPVAHRWRIIFNFIGKDTCSLAVTPRRTAQAPRQADEPVTYLCYSAAQELQDDLSDVEARWAHPTNPYSVTFDEEDSDVAAAAISPIVEEVFDSDSETSSLHPFSPPARTLALPDECADSVEILDDPPAVASPLVQGQGEAICLTSPDPVVVAVICAELAFMRQIDVGLLIAEIGCLQGGGLGAAPLTTPATCGLVEQSAVATEPIESAPLLSSALYFPPIPGLPSRGFRCSKVQVVTHAPVTPDHTLFQHLSFGLLGQMLQGLRSRPDRYCIRTTNNPVDIVREDYTYWMHGFCELGGWVELENEDDPTLKLLTPVGPSAARSAALESCNFGAEVPVYVIYVYHEASSTIPPAAMLGSAPPTGPTTTPIAPAPPPAMPSTSASQALPAVAEYLHREYAIRLQRIKRVRTLACGTGYRHCTEEKNIDSICTVLGINLSARHLNIIQVAGEIAISFDNVVKVAGLKKATFAAT